jgi:hypothetical protein
VVDNLAARPDVLTADNADQVRARVILEGANTTHVLRQVREFGTLLREAAEELARARIAEATGYRRSW